MSHETLAVIYTAYRATLEEQDDPVLWLIHSLRGNGAPISVLLRGSAVNYAVKEQDASGLSFGAKKQTHPPAVSESVAALPPKGVDVFYVEEDIAGRGIEPSELLQGLKPVKRSALAALYKKFDHVWLW